MFRSIEGQLDFITRIGIDGQSRVRVSDVNAIDVGGTSPDGTWVSVAQAFGSERLGVSAMPVYGGESRVLCYADCKPAWSPDAATLYLESGLDAPHPVLAVPLQPGRAFPDFPEGNADALTAWRKLPGARVTERPTSIPGRDESTYISTPTDERRNLFRVPLPR